MNHMKRLILIAAVLGLFVTACARGPGGPAVFDIPLVDIDESISCRQALRRLDDLNDRWNDSRGRSAFSEGLVFDEQVRQLAAIIDSKCDL